MASIIKANKLQDFNGNTIFYLVMVQCVITPNAAGIKNTPAFSNTSISSSISK